MGPCASCGEFILFGAVKQNDKKYCNYDCAAAGFVDEVAAEVPESLLREHAMRVRNEDCPACGGPGPVDVYVQRYILSALIGCVHGQKPKLCCGSCGTKHQLLGIAGSALVGWWSIHGIIMTPFILGSSVWHFFKSRDDGAPSERLLDVVRTDIAVAAIEEHESGPARSATALT